MDIIIREGCKQLKTVTIYHYDAFSNQPYFGNPAGIVLNGETLTDDDMQKIAFEVGFNETSFPIKSAAADLRIRYFTPGHEMNLCGHATVATIYALKTKGLLPDKKELTVETKAGILPVQINDQYDITMTQASPEFQTFNGSQEDLAASIGLHASELDDHLPIIYGSTGIWTLLIPIKKLASFKKMKPNNKVFPSILKEMPKASIHPFCLETYDPEAQMHARHFSSPYSGTIEDPVTGTASGVMGAYYAKYIKKNFKHTLTLLIEQGQEMGKDGRVKISVTKNFHNKFDVKMTGSAIFVTQFSLSL